MLNRFMVSVAALALIAGTGLANAQGTTKNENGASGAQPMQHSQSSGGAAERGAMGKESPHQKGTVGQAGGSSTMKSGEEKSSGAMEKSGTAEKSGGMEKSGAMNKNAADEKAGATKGEHAQSAQDKSMQDKSKTTTSDSTTKPNTKDMKAEDNKAGAAAKSNNAENRPATTDSKSQTTTGNAATSATAAPPPEKRTQIASAIKSEKIEETTNVNFNISVGATIPANVHFHPLPARIVEIYPEWRGYDVIFVHGEYIIVRPQTREIVYIIEG